MGTASDAAWGPSGHQCNKQATLRKPRRQRLARPQSGAMGQNGDLFMLDMGEAIRVVDLAADLIRLSDWPRFPPISPRGARHDWSRSMRCGPSDGQPACHRSVSRQTFTVLSSLLVAIHSPSGLNATDHTSSVCDASCC